jgi:uncharacterized membrane-anchored protein YitT (DUF2179 family)
MRGGVTVNDLLDRYSLDDRKVMYTIIEENLEITKTTQMPLL